MAMITETTSGHSKGKETDVRGFVGDVWDEMGHVAVTLSSMGGPIAEETDTENPP